MNNYGLIWIHGVAEAHTVQLSPVLLLSCSICKSYKPLTTLWIHSWHLSANQGLFLARSHQNLSIPLLYDLLMRMGDWAVAPRAVAERMKTKNNISDYPVHQPPISLRVRGGCSAGM